MPNCYFEPWFLDILIACSFAIVALMLSTLGG